MTLPRPNTTVQTHGKKEAEERQSQAGSQEIGRGGEP
jgi:hypothetical protein